MHLMQRIYGTMIAAAESPEQARARIDDAEAALGVDDSCRFCDIMLAIPAARACADVGDLVNTERWLLRAEDSGRIWVGTAWQASILELKAHLASVAGEQPEARRLLRGALTGVVHQHERPRQRGPTRRRGTGRGNEPQTEPRKVRERYGIIPAYTAPTYNTPTDTYSGSYPPGGDR